MDFTATNRHDSWHVVERLRSVTGGSPAADGGIELNWKSGLLEWNWRPDFRQTPKLKGDL